MKQIKEKYQEKKTTTKDLCWWAYLNNFEIERRGLVGKHEAKIEDYGGNLKTAEVGTWEFCVCSCNTIIFGKWKS